MITEDIKEEDLAYSQAEFYSLLDAGLSKKQLTELMEEQQYYDYDVTDEVELARALNIQWKERTNYDYGVGDYD